MDYTERVLRQRIAAIPDGEYRAEGFLDDDGRNRDVRLPIKVCVRIRGDGIEVDLTGSADQVETGFNVPFEGSTTGQLRANGSPVQRTARGNGRDLSLGEQLKRASDACLRDCAAALEARP